MDFLLKFKSPKHEARYNENLGLYTSRMVVTHSILCISVLPLYPLVQYFSFNSSAGYGVVIRRASLTWIINLSLLFLSIVLRRHYRRLDKRPEISRWCLDFLYCLVEGFEAYFWAEGINLTTSSYQEIWGWWHALTATIKINMISRWYLKFLAYLALIMTFGMKTFLLNTNYGILVVFFQAVIFLVLYTYFQERAEKKRFLEKETLFEETEALREIMEQTTEAIMICGINEGILYKNSNKFEWWNDDLSYEANLDRVQIENKTNSESVNPHHFNFS